MLSFFYRFITILVLTSLLTGCVSSQLNVTGDVKKAEEFSVDDNSSSGLNTWSSFSESNASVSAIALSDNGTLLAIGGDDPYVQLFDFKSRKSLKRFKTSNRWINDIAFSKRGELMAVAGDTEIIEVYDTSTAELLLKLSGHRKGVKSISFFKKDTMLVSGSLDKTVKLWNVNSTLPVKTLRGHTEGINTVAVTNDAKLIASGSSDGTIRIWDVEEGRLLRILREHKWHVLSVDFADDNQTLASGGGDNSIHLYNSRTGKLLRRLEKNRAAVTCVLFATDFLLTGSEDGSCDVWSYKRGELISQEMLPSNQRILTITSNAKRDTILVGGSHGIRYTDSFKSQINEKPFETVKTDVSAQLVNDLNLKKIPFIVQPVLPKVLPIYQDSFETKAMFLQRIEVLKHKRSAAIEEEVSEFGGAVEMRNRKVRQQQLFYEKLISTLKDRQKTYIVKAFQTVMNAPVLLPLYQDGRPAYDAEHATLEIELRMRGSNYSTLLTLNVEAGDAARELFTGIEDKKVKSRAYYRFIDEQRIQLNRVEVMFNSKKYLAYEKNEQILEVADSIKMLQKYQIKELDQYFLRQNPDLVDSEFELYESSLML